MSKIQEKIKENEVVAQRIVDIFWDRGATVTKPQYNEVLAILNLEQKELLEVVKGEIDKVHYEDAPEAFEYRSYSKGWDDAEEAIKSLLDNK